MFSTTGLGKGSVDTATPSSSDRNEGTPRGKPKPYVFRRVWGLDVEVAKFREGRPQLIIFTELAKILCGHYSLQLAKGRRTLSVEDQLHAVLLLRTTRTVDLDYLDQPVEHRRADT